MELNNTSIWLNAILPEDSLISDAIKCLDKTGLKIVMITDKKDVLIGTISDGDIRRGMLKGFTLDNSIKNIMHKDAFVAPPSLDKNLVKELMEANLIMQIPIVNKNGNILGLHTWEDINEKKLIPNKMIIMAGGKGQRLQPHTQNCPKPLLKIAGKPMLEHIIERAKKDGFENFIISINYLGHMIEDYFNDGSKFGVNIEYLKEDEPLGTAGSLSLLKDIPLQPFIVTNGDVITDIRYGELVKYHNENNSSATMAVKQYEIQNPYGVVETKDYEIIGFEEKPIIRSYINAGVYCISPEILSILDEGAHCDMPLFFEGIKKQNNKIIVYPMHEPWSDIGRPIDLKEINKE